QYKYTVYEGLTASLNINNTTGVIVEEGRMVVSGDDDNIEEVIAQAAPKQTLSPVHSLNELVQIWATYPAKANFTMKKANKLPLPEKEQEHVAKKLNLLQHFEIGIKAGFEHNNMTNRLVIAPYFERKISNKLSIIVQPALKLSFLKRQNIGDPETTYDIDHSKDKIHYDSTMVLVMPTKDTMWRRDFHFEQTHDSLRNQRYVGGAYTEIEIPLMLKYAVNNRLSVYGGINVLYSRLIRIKTATEYLGSSTLVNNNLFSFTGVPDPTIAQAFQYSGKSQAEYQYPEQPQNMLRLGYMLGVSYEINRRWKLDATLQQSSAPTNYQWGTNVNRSLALPNVRMTIGYRLGK
ncbi:MAG: hypothetical protein EBX41_08930, partial [Chitinophagia bacterium]|nr:hypothetical protein [Chitinophagia bacterium]